MENLKSQLKYLILAPLVVILSLDVTAILALPADATQWLALTLQIIAGLTLLMIVGLVIRAQKIFVGFVEINRELNEINQFVTANSLRVSDLGEKSLTEGLQAAQALQEAVLALEEISQLSTENAQACSKASELSGETAQGAETASKEMSKLTNVMDSLTRHSKAIQEISTTIDSISFQTNLLALNAAVEAARAGEEGRGFAVVADSVRSLAQKSGESAKNISNLIQNSTQEIHNGAKTAQTSHSLFGGVAEKIEATKKMSEEIAHATASQVVEIERINSAIKALDRATQVNTETISEVSQSAAVVSKEVDRLEEVIFSFQKMTIGNLQQDPQVVITELRRQLLQLGSPRVDGYLNYVGQSLPNFYFGSTSVTGQFQILDELKKRNGGAATIFATHEGELVRVSTNILKPEGGRAIGTTLAPGPARDALLNGRKYSGEIQILGAAMNAIYEPLIVGKYVCGALFYGLKVKR